MALLQDCLLWVYVLICFMIIWYGVALLLGLWEWLARRRSVSRLLRSALGLAAVWSAAWLVTLVGAATSY